MIVRKTEMRDVAAAEEIYSLARKFMHENGNPNQWINRPSKEDLIADIENGCGHVVEDEGEIIGVFFFCLGDDPTYNIIENGKWIDDSPYGVIHRVAVKYRGQGIVDFIYNYCFNIRQNIRIDTHRDNIPMQKSLLKNGFSYCGIIHLENGDERLAYQKTR